MQLEESNSILRIFTFPGLELEKLKNYRGSLESSDRTEKKEK
jgi:hypothetical protein